MVTCGLSDYKTGFGGRFGVQSERQDSCAVGFDYKEKLAKHGSQQGTVASQPHPPLPVPPLSTDLRIGLWSPPSPQGLAPPHCSAERNPLRTLFSTHFLLTCNLWGVCLVKGSVKCR